MNIDYLPKWSWIWLMVSMRFYAFFVICSLFDTRFLPHPIKILLSLVLGITILPVYLNIVLPGNILLLVPLLVKELVYGATFGYLVGLIFYLVQVTGAVIDTQRGESLGLVINNLGTGDSSIGKLLRQGFIAYFAAANGLLLVIGLIYHSFGYLPINQFLPLLSTKIIIHWFAEYFSLAIILALPAMGLMFLAEVVLGLISSFIPQLNVTVIAMPIKSFLALFILIFYVASLYHAIFTHYVSKLNSLL